MKSVLKSQLIKLLNLHRENDVVVEFDGYEIPIKGVYYNSDGDQIRITLHPLEVDVVKRIIQEQRLRDKVGKVKP